MQLNAAKCKELVIDFKKFKHHFESLVVSDKNLTVVQNAKIPAGLKHRSQVTGQVTGHRSQVRSKVRSGQT